MRDSSKKIMGGMLSGSLITMGLGLAFSPVLLFISFHHMFIVGIEPRGAFFVLLIPALLVVAGILVAARTLQNSRRAVGTVLVLLPVLVLIGAVPLGVLLGSMGMDIHWTSRVPFYIACTAVVLGLSGCVALGIYLRRDGGVRR